MRPGYSSHLIHHPAISAYDVPPDSLYISQLSLPSNNLLNTPHIHPAISVLSPGISVDLSKTLNHLLKFASPQTHLRRMQLKQAVHMVFHTIQRNDVKFFRGCIFTHVREQCFARAFCQHRFPVFHTPDSMNKQISFVVWIVHDGMMVI